MRLLSLKVTHFGCVDQAHIEFAPGLNVLYGPNDLGKSSLIEAIRAALLLPHASTALQEYVPWSSDRTPQVELWFAIGDDHYRVRKTFGAGSRGASTLEHSHDGVTWIEEAAARSVDGALRNLLRWGLQGPGGRSGKRGWPESFLTTLLLPAQAAVTAVFERDITGDADESGRERLAEALQAMARDERFLHILNLAQQRVDEAFTPKGLWKRGKDSPLTVFQRRTEEKQAELARWEDAARSGSVVADAVRRLHERRAEQRQRVAEAAARRLRAESLVNADAALAAARTELTQREAVVDAAARGERQLAELDRELAVAADALARLETVLQQARARLDAARADRHIGAEASTGQLTLREQDWQHRRLVLDKALGECAARRQLAERALVAIDHLATCARLHAQVAAQAGEITARRSALAEAARAAEQRLALLTQADVLVKLQALERELARESAAADEVTSLRERAARLAEQQATLREAAAAAPSQAVLDALLALANDLRVANARTGVGLSVELEPRHPIDVEVGNDGGSMRTHRDLLERLVVEANHEVVVRLPNIAALRASAGSADARRELLQLQARWQREAVPVLERHASADLAALGVLAAQATADRAEAERLAHDARSLLQRAQDLEARGRAAPAIDREEIARAWANLDRHAAEATLAALPEPRDRSLARAIVEAQGALRRAEEEQRGLLIDAARVEERLTSAAAGERAAQVAAAAARAGLGDDEPAAVAAGAAAAAATIATEMAAIDRDLAAAREQAERAANTARRELAAAEAALAAAERDERDARSRHAQVRQRRDEQLGAQRRLREEAQAVDLVLPRQAVAAAEQTLADLGEADASERESLPECLAQEAAARAELERIAEELLRAEGALKEVGGVVASERTEALRASVQRIDLDRQDCELDFQGWRLLVDTLKEAEGEEAVHLGRAVMPSVKQRFEQLTGARYGELALGPNLEAQGIVVGGGTRDLRALSVGTQEQLSTIFRLALADQLATAVILDDQLTQTDARRMRWFREQLKQIATRIQVVVVTCHADDYLEAGEAAGEGPVRDSGVVRAVDLERVVSRR